VPSGLRAAAGRANDADDLATGPDRAEVSQDMESVKAGTSSSFVTGLDLR
jgi:hypothetical protein